MTLLTVVAKVVAKEENVESVKRELLKLIAPTREEKGCFAYTLHQDTVDPALFIFYETWESKTCLERHMHSDHFQQYISAVEGMIAEKTVHVMNLLA